MIKFLACTLLAVAILSSTTAHATSLRGSPRALLSMRKRADEPRRLFGLPILVCHLVDGCKKKMDPVFSPIEKAADTALNTVVDQLEKLPGDIADGIENYTVWGLILKKTGGAKIIKGAVNYIWNEARCSVIKQAAKKIINKGVTAAYKKLGGDEMCAADAAEAAAMCELVGFGPEDPFADECAVALAVGFEMACKEAVKKGVAFTADQVMNHINGCHGDLDKDAKQKLAIEEAGEAIKKAANNAASG